MKGRGGRPLRRCPSIVALCALALGWLLAVPFPSAAQTVVGRLLEEVRERPVPGASVSLVRADGTAVVEAVTDSLGRFVLVPDRAGEYTVVAVHTGYETGRSPLLALGTEGSVTLDMLVRPAPVPLPGLEVEVEREWRDLLQTLGLTPESLGDRWVDRETIDRIAMPGTAFHVLDRQGIAGVRIPRRVPACATFARARTGGGNDRCALVIVNGVATPRESAAGIDGREIEAIALLRPFEAVPLYGTVAGGGAVLIWTRRGGPR